MLPISYVWLADGKTENLLHAAVQLRFLLVYDFTNFLWTFNFTQVQKAVNKYKTELLEKRYRFNTGLLMG